MKIIIANTNVQALLKGADAILGENRENVPENIKGQAVLAFLKNRFEKKYFDICKLEDLAKVNNITIPVEKRQFMEVLHCVYYDQMTQETKDYLFATLVDLFRTNISMAHATGLSKQV